MRQDFQRLERIVAAVLRWGSGLSIVLMAAGLGLLLAKDGSSKLHDPVFAGLSSLFTGAAALEPAAIMTLGVVVLLFTPVLTVAAAGFSFLIVERDIKHACVSLGVLVILAASFFVPGFK